MSIESDVIDLLLADSGVTTLVSTRIYPGFVPQTKSTPAIVVTRRSTARESDLDGNDYVQAIDTINCLDSDYDTTVNIAAAVRAALLRSEGDLGVVAIDLQDEMDDPAFVEGLGLQNRVVQYLIAYTE